MLKKEEIWQSIKMFQKQSKRELDQTRESEDQSSFISDNEKENLFKNKQQSCQCKQQLLSLKKECMLQIRELKAQHQIEMENLQNQFQKIIIEQKQQYEQEISQLKEDLEFYIGEQNDKELMQLIEQEQQKDKEIFQQQLEFQITEKLKLEQKFILCQKELKQYKEQAQYFQTTQQNQQIQQLQQSVHKNCAPQLFRDTNRKVKLQTEGIDRSIVNDDNSNRVGICNSIKNFNATIKHMEKSQQSQC
ncbi:unnamed protein product (macronuclear) [Paramecium tetraurelia]|uniref:Uncharacterized protein n=1 Tax=Paramecium tetraurelia TaxID=5888 RepID=A0CLX8_PARTE|nr:uncharacterized protein GSPATT00008274001 [Paramecium tetraurelia]CAK71795.1 unnamed protein product [Paramecium tetraurelia]|eukprot:XP_001439192.1 hypothetical protein (macronuclear) [Paramecium tetraurelia strain d4-2]